MIVLENAFYNAVLFDTVGWATERVACKKSCFHCVMRLFYDSED